MIIPGVPNRVFEGTTEPTLSSVLEERDKIRLEKNKEFAKKYIFQPIVDKLVDNGLLPVGTKVRFER